MNCLCKNSISTSLVRAFLCICYKGFLHVNATLYSKNLTAQAHYLSQFVTHSSIILSFITGPFIYITLNSYFFSHIFFSV